MNDGAIIHQVTDCIEMNRDFELFNMKENLQSRFWLMLNISILSESFCSVFHAVFCKLLIVFINLLY